MVVFSQYSNILPSLHPIAVFFLETTLTACIIAGTPPRSRIRSIGVIPIALCTYAVVLTSASHMRLPWASLLSGSSIGFLLQYIDIVLLNKLHIIPDTGNLKNPTQTPPETNALARIKWGFWSTFNFRYANTSMEVKNVPHFQHTSGSIVAPSRRVFVLTAIATATLCYLTLDFFALQPPLENATTILSWQSVSVFSRMSQITAPELTIRAFMTSVYWVNMFCVMQGITSLAGSIAVTLRLSEVNSWRPLFGSMFDAYSLRNFWGIFWHQTLRRILSDSASYLTREVLMIPKGGLDYRYTHLLFVFLISGILHWFAELGGGMPLEASGTMRFFITQVFGITLEDTIAHIYYSIPGNVKDASTVISLKLLGYIWVVLFLIWSTPAWLYPVAARPADAPIVPYSIISRYLSL